MSVISPFLMPLSFFYGFLTDIRVWAFDKGFLKSEKLQVPVISVGNLTVGGTGKTPFVDVLINQLEAKGLKVGVLTRGYGRKSTDIVDVQVNTAADICGDEPLWLKQKHPQAQIIVGANRLEGAKKFQNVDVIILDDGMQHLKIKRDLEITLIDSTRGQEHYRLLPWGRARERIQALRRSDFVVLTKTNLTDSKTLDEMVDLVFDKGILDVIESSSEFSGCEDLVTKEKIELSGKKVFLCSGIANPTSFELLVKSQGVSVDGHEKMADHADVSSSKLEEIYKKAKDSKLILITEKDAVKWRQITAASPIPIGVIKTKMLFTPELPSFYELVSHSHY